MKRMNFWSMGVLVLLLTFTACNDEIAEVQSSELKQIVMTASDFDSEDGSRTNFLITDSGAEFSWAANDTVGIFPNEGAQAFFPMISGAGTKSANFTGGGWALKDASTYGAYYPFIGSFYLDKNSIPVDYTGQKQTGDASTAHLGAYDYMAAIPATPVDGNVTFAFKHLGALVQLKLTVPQPTTLTSVTLTTENNSFAVKGKVDIMTNTRVIESTKSAKELTLDLKDITTTEPNQVVTLYMMIPPVDLSTKVLKAKVKTNSGSEEVILNSKNFLAGKIYAVSGSMEDKEAAGIDGGTVTITTAGTLRGLLGDDYLKIGSLKVVGPINGDDIYYLRMMMGGSEFKQSSWGKLTTLDLSNASIVEGGDYYYYYEHTYSSLSVKNYTSNNTVGDYMFYDCDLLQNIILPNNIVLIGKYAFSGCSFLKSVEISNAINTIEYEAFSECDGLETITIEGSGLTTLKSHVFMNCDALSSVIIGDGVISIDSSLFLDCHNLREVTIGNNVSYIPDMTFAYCNSLKKMTIGRGVNEIEYGAFYCAYPENVEVYISDLAAWCSIDCTESPMSNGGGKLYLNNELLTEVTIPEGVVNVGSVFEGCASITKVTIPEGVVSVGSFGNCTSLTSVQISNTVESLYGFENCTSLTDVIIPNSVTSIYSLANCIALTEVKLGNGVTSISDCI